ncbi:MFS transporter (plasmid) [Haloarcula sp. NS06]|uniref:Major facilitator superfamily transport protein n=3 Tax=Halobacteriales TaxID=2235 RepID=B0R8T8_HALS3|nr:MULTISPECIES: MFS transporter [Halobacteria]MBB6090956.1 MFS family permease [Halobacterium salinarum]MDL0139405.1 MFS transporter [Halobacterium salinarum]CAP15124.1 major facilitator superfamily transport protein [Halobacterium salinarum R1]CAP15364.1 major facilitator superfamily transport protein [Halobacterium salinarum R1]
MRTALSNPLTDIQQSQTVLIIFASTLVSVMGVSLISPALPTIQAAWNISASQASLLISAFTLPGIVLTPFIGLIADRVGRKRVLVPSLFLFGVSGIAVVFVDEFTTLLGLRVVQGTAGSAIMSLTVTLLGDLFSGEQQSRLIGLNAAILAIGAAGYPLLGGGLALLSWAAPFVCFALGIVVAVAGSAILPEPESSMDSSGLSYVVNAAQSVPTRTALGLYVAIFGIFFVLYGAQLTVVPFILDESYGLSSGMIGLLLGLPAVTMGVTSSQSSRLMRHLSPPRLITLGFVTYGIGMTLAALAHSITVLAGALFLFGIGQGFAEPITDTALNTLAPDAFRGGIMSIRTSVLQFGTTLGPPVFVAVASIVGYTDTLLIAGLAALALGISAFGLLTLSETGQSTQRRTFTNE